MPGFDGERRYLASTTRPGGPPFPVPAAPRGPTVVPRRGVARARDEGRAYDPDRPLAAYLYSCLPMLSDRQAAALRRRVPPRLPAAGLAEIAAELGIPQQGARDLIDQALDRIDSRTGFRSALAPRLRCIAREAPRELASVAREGWARGIDPTVLPSFLAACGGLHVVAVPGHGRFVVPFGEALWDEANRLLRAAAAVAAEDGHPFSLTKGALGKLDASPEARLACSRLLGRLYAGCDVAGIQARLALADGGVGRAPGGGAPTDPALDGRGRREATCAAKPGGLPDGPPTSSSRSNDGHTPDVVPDGKAAGLSGRPPPPARGRTRAARGGITFVQAGLLALEESRYPIPFGKLRDLIAERTGRRPSDASVWAALSAHGERLERGRDLWRLRADGSIGGLSARSAPSPSAQAAPAGAGAASPRRPPPATASTDPVGASPDRPPSGSEWTLERDAILRGLWQAGESVRVIAERVGGGATRDTVMSRLAQLRLF